MIVPQDGYVTAYVGNESDSDVFFDDITIEHRQGLQVQEVHYDPAGLELAGLTPPSPGIRGLNQYKFNGQEFQADLGLSWNHQDWRFFDPQLLRWHSVDPEVENGQEAWSPYAFGFDNAVRYADADGRKPGDPWYQRAAEWASNLLKGTSTGTNQRYQTYPPGGDTRFGIQDTKAGRIKNGSPVGAPVVRFDVADKTTKYPHVNFNPALRGKPDNIPHTPIPGGASALKGLEVAGKTLDAVGKVAKPLAIATDVVRVGEAVRADGGIGVNTARAAASIAGGWAGAYIGGVAGAEGGAMAGGAVGAFFGGVGAVPGAAIGGFIGGIGGGIIGSFGGSWASEKAVNAVVEPK